MKVASLLKVAEEYSKEKNIPIPSSEDGHRFQFFSMTEKPVRRIVRVIEWSEVQEHNKEIAIFIREGSNFFELTFKKGTPNFLNIEVKGKCLDLVQSVYSWLLEVDK